VSGFPTPDKNIRGQAAAFGNDIGKYYEPYAQALLLVGFSFIIRYSHRPFFTFYLTLLAMGLISAGFIFLLSS